MLTKTYYISDQFHIDKVIDGYNLVAKNPIEYDYDDNDVLVYPNEYNFSDFHKIVKNILGLEEWEIFVNYYSCEGYDFQKVRNALEVMEEFNLIENIYAMVNKDEFIIEGKLKYFENVDKILKKCEI